MKKDASGFTLVETLLTLMIVTIFLLLPSLHSNQLGVKREENLFFTQLETKMNQMQLHAIVNGQATSMVTNHQIINFTVLDEVDHLLNETLTYPETVFLKGPVRFMTFNANTGNTSSFYTIQFETSQGPIKYVFQLGSGRYRVEK